MAAYFAQANITYIFLRKSKIYVVIYLTFLMSRCIPVYSALLIMHYYQNVLVWGFTSKQTETCKNRFG